MKETRPNEYVLYNFFSIKFEKNKNHGIKATDVSGKKNVLRKSKEIITRELLLGKGI